MEKVEKTSLQATALTSDHLERLSLEVLASSADCCG
jgi:hypothetical protein